MQGKDTTRFSLIHHGTDLFYMQAMLLAAGLGTRLRPYTLVRPKPLFPILNRPLLEILLDMLRQAGCNRIVVNSHHLTDQVEKAIFRRKGLYHQHEPEILGTGGSLRQALPLFRDEPILVMNGDIFHTIDLAALYRHHQDSGKRITMAMHDHPRFNTVATGDGTIRSFRPRKDQDLQQVLAFTGIHVVDPKIIEMIPSQQFFHIIDLYEELVHQGEEIGILRVDGSLWYDIGTIKDYLALHAQILTGPVHQTLPLPPPQNPWHISDEAAINDDVRLSGWGCIGRARVGSNVHLRNCVVWDDAEIPAGKHIENTVITSRLQK